MAIWLSGCLGAPSVVPPTGGKSVEQAHALLAESPTSASPAERPNSVGTFDEPAEPFSASWLEAPEQDEPLEIPIDSWVNADACPDPPEEARDLGDPAYQAFVDRTLGLGVPGELAALRISPSFTPERSLSVVRQPTGAYLIRSTRLKTNAWAQMMDEMRALQGESFSLDDASEAAALARVTTSKVVYESGIDASTAWLTVALWRAVTARAQRVVEIGTHTYKLDGTMYDIRQGGRGSAPIRRPATASWEIWFWPQNTWKKSATARRRIRKPISDERAS
jgi:hypothetical protein